ncbi:SLIT and NTRK-like protein 5 isoform X2 [Chrysoperla carnea]|nr:SLIT and NTRK-like protein 5 isoform X2 [Chrysoperla carnea]
MIITIIKCATINKDDICKFCKCVKPNEQVVLMDCTLKNLTTTPANLWPSQNNETKITFITVNLSHNKFVKLGKLPATDIESVHVSLSNCMIREIERCAFAPIPNIEYLDLSWNQLNGDALRPSVFQGKFNIMEYDPLNKLEGLDLSHNNIHALRDKTFDHIPNLKNLYISHNPLKVFGLTTLAAISMTPYLRILDLSSTNLEHISDEAFAVFKELTVLILSNNHLKNVPDSLTYASDSLRKLDFSGNAVQEFNDDSFFGLKSLTHLNISCMENLKTIHSGTFQWLENLNALHISHNPQLTHIDKDAFGELKLKWPISELYINNNSLHQVSTQLAVWEKIVQLDLSDNPWRCDCQLYHVIKKIKIKYRERNQKFPVCSEPTYLSGISLYNMPTKICNKPKLNSTLDEIFDTLFNDDDNTDDVTSSVTSSNRNRNVGASTTTLRSGRNIKISKFVWGLLACCVIILLISLIAIGCKIYLKSKQQSEQFDRFKPIRYHHTKTSDTVTTAAVNEEQPRQEDQQNPEVISDIDEDDKDINK